VALIAYAEGVDSPRTDPAEVARLTGLQGEVEVLLGWTLDERPWLASPGVRGWTTFPGWAQGSSGADRRLRYVPTRLSAVPRLLAGVLRPDVAVVAGVRRGGGLAFAATAGWGPAAALAARRGVVVEVDPTAPDLGAPAIPGQVLAVVERPAGGALDPPRDPGAEERAVGRHVAALLPEGATIQVGPGGIAEAVLAALDRPVRVWSGLISDGVARLDERGLLEGTAVGGYAWGGEPLTGLARRGRLRLLPVEATHDGSRVAAIDRFVACNTAVQLGLDGSVNVERVGARAVAGIGGHADFCAAAAHSAGGLSVIALRSTTRRGASTIVAAVDVVSTPRCDVEVVVTEHGVADLRGVDDAERARRIIAVAAPEHRPRLAAGDG
jgi:acyl-CoA hydrolase